MHKRSNVHAHKIACVCMWVSHVPNCGPQTNIPLLKILDLFTNKLISKYLNKYNYSKKQCILVICFEQDEEIYLQSIDVCVKKNVQYHF